MTLTVNGEPVDLAEGTTLQELVDSRLASTRGVAAAVDGSVVTRGAWATFTLRAGQAIELLTAVQGG
jgi:sulfur carrier protein